MKNRISSPPEIDAAGGDISFQRTLKVLFVHPQSEPSLFSDRILASHGGHLFNFELEKETRAGAVFERLATDQSLIDLILLDLSVVEPSAGLGLFSQIQEIAAGLPAVILCSAEDEAIAIDILRLGAMDYVLKQNLDDHLLGHVLRRAIDRHHLLEEISRQKQNLAASEALARKMVKQLREEIAKRKQTEKLKDDFINTASHELRSPLTVIKGVIDNFKEGILGSLADAQMDYIEIASRHADRQSKIIDNLLDMSRLESGRAKMNRSRTDAAGLVRALLRDFEIMASELGLTLKADIPANLPPLYADPDMLSQVLVNLLSNAVKFAKRKIVIRAREVDEQKVRNVIQHTLLQELIGIQFTVQDDGTGIPPDDMKHLFNKFAQFHRSSKTRGHKGTGLGLAICKEVVELHQGKIWAESRPDHGTQFHFILPKYDDEIAIHALVSQTLDDASKNASPLSILVLTILNMEDLRKSVRPEELETIYRRIQEEVEGKILRPGDRIQQYPGKSAFVILVQSGSEGASSVKRRMRARIEDMFQDWPGARPIFGVGTAIYPDPDGQNQQHAPSCRSILNYAFDHVEMPMP